MKTETLEKQEIPDGYTKVLPQTEKVPIQAENVSHTHVLFHILSSRERREEYLPEILQYIHKTRGKPCDIWCVYDDFSSRTCAMRRHIQNLLDTQKPPPYHSHQAFGVL